MDNLPSWQESLDPEYRDRLIAYHDSVCVANCGDDISTYPIPPDDWKPDVNE